MRVGLELRAIGFETRQSLVFLTQAPFGGAAARVRFRARRLRSRQRPFGCGQRRLRVGDRAGRVRTRRRIVRLRRGEFGLFLGQPGERLVGIDDERILARAVALHLGDAALEFRHAPLDATFFAVERLARDDQLLQRRRGVGFGIPQGGQDVGGDGGEACRLRLRARRLADGAQIRFVRSARVGQTGLGIGMFDQRVQRLGLANGGGELFVFARLPCLTFQAVGLHLDLLQHVVEPQEVFFRRAQAQFGLVPPGAEPGDAGRLFEDAAARLRLGGDDLADLSLPHHGGGARARRRIGEQELDVAGAGFASVDAVGGAGVPLDAACHFEHVRIVEGGRRPPVGIVEDEPDFGDVSRRPRPAAREDHVVHAGGAHVARGILAHHPTQGLDEIRLAAAVRPDDPRQPRLDDEIRLVDERLEAEEAQFA